MATLETVSTHFDIKIEEATTEKNGDLRARIYVKPKGSDESFFDENCKISGRGINGFANTIQDTFGADEEETNELKKHILKRKSEIRDIADSGGSQTQNRDEEQLQDTVQRIMEKIHESGGKADKDAIADETGVDNVWGVLDEVDPKKELVIPGENNSLRLTDKGSTQIKEMLGYETFDGDPDAEAQRQLESENPLRIYLDSFNKIHKGDHLLKVWELITALSCRCADRQLHSWSIGSSGSGKSHLKRNLLKYMPNEMYTRKESISPKALQYKTTREGPDFMNQKLVYFDEIGGDDVEDAIELMRLMTDQDQDLVTHETVRDGEPVQMTLNVSNITVWFTSVQSINDEQLKNRFILTNPDSSQAQNDTVFEHQQQILNAGGDLDFVPKETPVIQSMIFDVTENTDDLDVVIPMDIFWPFKHQRRLYPVFTQMTGVLAKIHYRNRVIKDGMIIATEADVRLAILIFSKLVETTVTQVAEDTIALLRCLPESRANALRKREIMSRLPGFNTSKVEEKVEQLKQTEELQLINEDYVDGKYEYWAGSQVDELLDKMPSIEKIGEDCAKKWLDRADVEPDEEIMESIFETEIPVTDYLRSQLDEEEAVDEVPDVTEAEQELLRMLKEMEWELDVTSVRQLHDADRDEVEDLIFSLEEKEIVRVDEDEMVRPESMFDRLEVSI